jgi:hypothetical protein
MLRKPNGMYLIMDRKSRSLSENLEAAQSFSILHEVAALKTQAAPLWLQAQDIYHGSK